VNWYYGIALLSVSAVLGVMTVRRLWRRGRNPWERMVYDTGVRGVGVWGAISFPILFSILALGTQRSSLEIATVAVWALIVGMPLSLWAGYWWGRTMAAYFNIPRTSDTKSTAPPVA
jgi:hypothetical protein